MQARAAILASTFCLAAIAASTPVSRACSCLQSKRRPEQALQDYDSIQW
jgi:hypothetical protein